MNLVYDIASLKSLKACKFDMSKTGNLISTHPNLLLSFSCLNTSIRIHLIVQAKVFRYIFNSFLSLIFLSYPYPNHQKIILSKYTSPATSTSTAISRSKTTISRYQLPLELLLTWPDRTTRN